MKTELVTFDDEAIDRAVALLQRGELVAFPTETVYGLGVRADDDGALARIFATKGRPEDKPLIIHVATVDQARELAAEWSELAEGLTRLFWPGPLTLVVTRCRSSTLGHLATAGGDTVAVRAPDHPAARRLLKRCPFPVAAPSANVSHMPPPRDAQEVMAYFEGRIPMIIDGGPTGEGAPSTILDITDPHSPKVLRIGALAVSELRRAFAAPDWL